MALATRCPHCQTAFRVASDQLKLRAGLVRCGTCKEIFNGIENLLHPDEDINAVVNAPSGAGAGRWPAPVASSRAGYAASYAPVRLTPLVRAPASLFGPGALNSVAPFSAPSIPTDTLGDNDNDGDGDGDGDSQAHDAATVGSAPDDLVDDAADFSDETAATGSAEYLHPAVDAWGDPDALPAAAFATPDSHDGQSSASLWLAATDESDQEGSRLPTAPLASKSGPTGQTGQVAEAGFEHVQNGAVIAPSQAAMSPLPGLLRPSRIDAAHAAPMPDDVAKDLLTELPVVNAGVNVSAATPRMPPSDSIADPDADADADADDVPDFIARDLRRQGLQRVVQPLLYTVAIVLILLFLGQLSYAFRTSIAANFPQTRPLLDDACRILGCSVGLPMQIDSVSIESSEFQPLADKRDQFLLNVLLRNRSTTVQAWPSIELTLNDSIDKVVARRIIGPRDYLPVAVAPGRGFDAGSEQPIRLVFELARLSASGYRVYLFYP